MTDKDMKVAGSDSDQKAAKQEYAIGYGRPPIHSRFKPGQSGNPKGRPKGVRNLRTLRRALYLEPTRIRDGEKLKTVPRVLAIDAAVMSRALKGDPRAAVLASKTAKELGVYDESFPATGYPLGLTQEQIACLSDEDLETLIRILTKVQHMTESPRGQPTPCCQ